MYDISRVIELRVCACVCDNIACVCVWQCSVYDDKCACVCVSDKAVCDRVVCVCVCVCLSHLFGSCWKKLTIQSLNKLCITCIVVCMLLPKCRGASITCIASYMTISFKWSQREEMRGVLQTEFEPWQADHLLDVSHARCYNFKPCGLMPWEGEKAHLDHEGTS